MTAVTTKPGQKRRDNSVLNTLRWAKISGNLRKNASKGREAATTADAAGTKLENYDKIRQNHPKTKILGKYRSKIPKILICSILSIRSKKLFAAVACAEIAERCSGRSR